MALSLLIDTSSSMEDRMATAQDAAIGFVRKLRPTDLGEVIGFDSRAEVLQKFTSNTAELEQAIRKTVAGGSTSMNNAMYISLKGLKKIPVRQEDEIRRQAIILLSDGEDTSSLVTFEDVLDLARRSETAIYAIGLMDEAAAGQSKGFREATYALRQLTNDTGGRAFFPADVKTLATVYGQIYDELSSQYTIGYTSKNPRRDGAWRRLVVRVARPNVQARTKQGYFAPLARRPIAQSRGLTPYLVERASDPFSPIIMSMNAILLFLYAAAGVAYAVQFARRTFGTSRVATVLLVLAAFAHTFVIGMETMRVGHVPFASATSAISTFVWLLALSYLYVELTTGERAMGVFILPLLVVLQAIPAFSAVVDEPRSVILESPWFGVHVSSLLFAYASFALAAVLGINDRSRLALRCSISPLGAFTLFVGADRRMRSFAASRIAAAKMPAIMSSSIIPSPPERL